MRLVVQRVTKSSVEVDGIIAGAIGKGLLVLVGVTHKDDESDVDWLSNKLTNIRLFSDENDKMNYSVKDVEGDVLIVSQFTLFASTKKGTRPSFTNAADPSKAEALYEKFKVSVAANLEKNIASGVFGADMKLSIDNDGPVTVLLDSKNRY